MATTTPSTESLETLPPTPPPPPTEPSKTPTTEQPPRPTRQDAEEDPNGTQTLVINDGEIQEAPDELEEKLKALDRKEEEEEEEEEQKPKKVQKRKRADDNGDGETLSIKKRYMDGYQLRTLGLFERQLREANLMDKDRIIITKKEESANGKSISIPIGRFINFMETLATNKPEEDEIDKKNRATRYLSFKKVGDLLWWAKDQGVLDSLKYSKRYGRFVRNIMKMFPH